MKHKLVEAEVQKLEKLANLMDSKFLIPGTQIRFGIDSLLGLIPVLGDTATIFITLYLIQKSKQYNMPRAARAQMAGNALADWAIGMVPFLGDFFDIKWKANIRNVALIKRHLTKIT